MEKGQKPYKNCFLRWSKNQKMDFLQKLPDTICVRKGEKTRIFVHTICFGQKCFFGPKQCKAGNAIKIVVSTEIAKTKNDTFFWKGFWHG